MKILMSMIEAQNQRTKVRRLHLKTFSNWVVGKGHAESTSSSTERAWSPATFNQCSYNAHGQQPDAQEKQDIQQAQVMPNYTQQPQQYNWDGIDNQRTKIMPIHALPRQPRDAKHFNNTIASNYNATEGSGKRLHDNPTTVRVLNICDCTGMLCPVSPTSADASGHRLRGVRGHTGLRTCTDKLTHFLTSRASTDSRVGVLLEQTLCGS